VERNLNPQKTRLSYILFLRLSKRFLSAPARSNMILSLKHLHLDRMVDTVRYVTSKAIFSLFG